jgi:hypothetical protein
VEEDVSTSSSTDARPGRLRLVLSTLWLGAVTLVFGAAYGNALITAARAAADRFPLLERVLRML